MLLHNHLDMIGRNEPIQRKAKFWQSYVRALKGTDDIRAPEATHYSRYPSSRGIFRPILDSFPTWPTSKSIFDDPITATDRMSAAGYRYLPISRETYGLTPRNIYPHHYSSLNRTPRLADQDYATRHLGEFKHDDEGHFQFEYYTPPCSWDPTEGRQHDQKHLNPQYRRASQRPFVKEYTIGPDGAKVPLYTHSGMANYTIKSVFLKPFVSHIWDSSYWPRSYWPRSIWPRSYWPRTYWPRSYWPRSYLHRQPIYSRGGFTKKHIPDLYEPKNWIPLSRFDRDPWWWSYPSPKPFEAPYIPLNHSPFFLRDSFLSPVKNTYLWRDHPIRPFSTTPRLTF